MTAMVFCQVTNLLEKQNGTPSAMFVNSAHLIEPSSEEGKTHDSSCYSSHGIKNSNSGVRVH